MKPLFVDTSYYAALLSQDDAWHDAAVEWSDRSLGRQVVTEYVLVELGSAFSKSDNRHLYAPFVKQLLSEPSTAFIPASANLFNRGLALFAKRPDKEWSLVDCISFVVMQERRLTDALTTDHHFKQAGFRALLT
jgi:predicted nucleic acid-binding protein